MEKVGKKSVMISDGLWDKIDQVAAAEGMTRQSLIRSTLIKRVGYEPAAPLAPQRPAAQIRQYFAPPPAPPEPEVDPRRARYANFVNICKTMGYPYPATFELWVEKEAADIAAMEAKEERERIDAEMSERYNEP